MDHAQEPCLGLRKEKCTSPKPRRVQSREKHLGKHSQIRIHCLRRIPEERTNSGWAVDVEDAYNRVQFKLLMELIVQYGISLMFTRWLAVALQERKVAMWLGNWISMPKQLTMGLPQGPPSPPVHRPLCLHKGTDGSDQQWFKPGVYACGWWAYIQNSQWHPHCSHHCPGAARKRSHWCQETESEINPSKAQALWCTLQNKAVGQEMPAVSFNGEAIECTASLRYLGIHFDRMLTYKTQVKSTKLGCTKGLSTLKAMDSKGIQQHYLFLLYQSAILCVIYYGVGLTTLSQSNQLKLDRVQNDIMRGILGTTKDTPTEAICYLLDLPSIDTRHKVDKVKAYLTVMQNPLHNAVKKEKGCRLARGKSWMGQAEQSVKHECGLTELKQVRDWEKRPVEFKPYYDILLSENSGTHCLERPAGKANA